MDKTAPSDRSPVRRDLRLSFQVRSIGPALAVSVTLTLAVFGLVLWLQYTSGINSRWFLQDPAARLKAPFYTGAVSYLGILLWTATATLCFITSAVIRQVPDQLYMARFLLFAGGLTTFLMLDDLFQLHELVFPKYVGIPQNMVFVLYVVIALCYLRSSRKAILQTDYLLKLIALFFFGCSVLTDMLQPQIFRSGVFEDAAKFAGIATWLTYFTRESFFLIRSQMVLPASFATRMKRPPVIEGTRNQDEVGWRENRVLRS